MLLNQIFFSDILRTLRFVAMLNRAGLQNQNILDSILTILQRSVMLNLDIILSIERSQ